MTKRNQKGMTSIEMLAAFAIVAVIVVSLFDVVLNYKNREQTEAVYREVVAYANNIEKTVQDDLIKNRLNGITISTNKVTLQFEKIASTTFSFEAGSYSSNKAGKITYKGIDYALPDISDLTLDPLTSITKIEDDSISYLKIHIVLRHPNLKEEEDIYSPSEASYQAYMDYGTYSFNIVCPIGYSD